MESNQSYSMGQDYSRKDSMFFTFQGRINRLSFFLRIIALIVIAFFSALAVGFFVGLLTIGGAVGFILAMIVVIGFVIAIWIASLSLYVRRLHDMNLSGIWVLGYIVISLIIGGLEVAVTVDPALAAQAPAVIMIRLVFNILVIISLLLLLFWPGTKGPNKYGEDPLNRNSEYIDEVFGDGKPKPNYATDYTPAYLRKSIADNSQKSRSPEA